MVPAISGRAELALHSPHPAGHCVRWIRLRDREGATEGGERDNQLLNIGNMLVIIVDFYRSKSQY